MTITVTDIDQGPYVATGAAQTVPYTFMTLTDDEIDVFYDVGLGRVLIDPAVLTVMRNKNVDGSAKEGGAVELAAEAAPSGSSVYLRAAPRGYRDLVWSDVGSRLRNLNDEQDRLTLIYLVQSEILSRAIVAAPGALVPDPQSVIDAALAVQSKQDRNYTAAPGRIRSVNDRLTQDFHLFDVITSKNDQDAIKNGTSATDWSDALEEAFGRLNVSSQDEPGRVMEMPAGQMYFSRTLIKPYAAKLIGKGRAYTRLISLDGSGHGLVIPAFDQGGYVGGIQIERAVDSDAGTYGLYLSHGTSDIVIDRIGVAMFANAAFGGSTDYGQLIQCRFDDCYGDGWVQQDTRPPGTPDDPSNYDPAVQWHLYKPLVRWCEGVAYKIVASAGGRGVIAGEWNDPGTFENGQSMLALGAGSTAKGVYDIRINGGFFGSDNSGPDIETYGKNNEFRFNLIERIGLDAYGPRFNPDGTPRTRSAAGGAGYGRAFRAGPSNGLIRLEANFDDTAGYSVIQACPMIVDVRAKNPGLATDEQVVIKQFAGKLTGQVASEGATVAVNFATDEAHLVRVSGPVTGVATSTSVVTTPGGEREALKVAGTSLLNGKETGFVPMTGSARKTTFPTYGAGTAGAAYTQAQIQGIMDALVAVSERVKAHDDALLAGKVPGA